MEDWKYQHISILESLKPTPRILLGQYLFWTEKKDGECISLWINKSNHIQVSSKNQENAHEDIKHKVTVLCKEDYDKCVELLEENPQFVLFVEECKKGRSVTGAEVYNRHTLFLFDIYDRNAEKFLNYTAVYQHAYHYKIPVVGLYAKTRHRTMKDLLKFANHALEYCKEEAHIEGIVIKAYEIPEGFEKWEAFKRGLIQAKIKLDIPEPKKRKIAKGEVIYPPIPENEILGAINKAHQELGDTDIQDVSKAMPLIAQYVKEECKKHLYSTPIKKLFFYYKNYLERFINQ